MNLDSRRPNRFFRVTLYSVVVLFAIALVPVRAALPAASARSRASASADDKSSAVQTTKLKIRVLTDDGKPVGNASVYVRFYANGGFLHHDKLDELDLKTNEDGTVKVPPVPQGKILVQVIAKGWHTFGKWYDVEKDEESIEIKLEPPPHWY
jgi:hypothetical protein